MTLEVHFRIYKTKEETTETVINRSAEFHIYVLPTATKKKPPKTKQLPKEIVYFICMCKLLNVIYTYTHKYINNRLQFSKYTLHVGLHCTHIILHML